MARHKEFDRDKALDGAIDVFWRHGYEGTSTGMLVDAMGIGRQSLYDTFGDKKQLYLEALRRYNDTSIGQAMEAFKGAPGPLAGIGAILEALIAVPDLDRAKGCFGINATCEHGVADPEVRKIMEASTGRLHAVLDRAVREGQRAGEIAPTLTTEAAIAYLHTIMAGLRVMMRGGADCASLDGAVALGLRALTPT